MLESDDLNDVDEAILDGLHEGRGPLKHLAGLLKTDRSYVSQRLKRLVEHGHVDRVASGLYEIADDPREDVEPESDVDALQECIDETQSELEKSKPHSNTVIRSRHETRLKGPKRPFQAVISRSSAYLSVCTGRCS